MPIFPIVFYEGGLVQECTSDDVKGDQVMKQFVDPKMKVLKLNIKGAGSEKNWFWG